MKRRIEQLLNGIFEYEQMRLVLRPEELSLKGASGDVLHGKFFVEGMAGERVHGFLYPSDARMICDPVEFHGISNEIHCQFDCSGLKKGSDCGGKIVVCSDHGEYEIPYTVSIAAAPEAEELPFADLEEFVRLARADYRKAYRYFLTPGFSNLLKERAELLSLYEGLLSSNVTGQGRERTWQSLSAMEEFLTGAGWKEPVVLKLAGTENPRLVLAAGESGAAAIDSAAEKAASDADNSVKQETVLNAGDSAKQETALDTGDSAKQELTLDTGNSAKQEATQDVDGYSAGQMPDASLPSDEATGNLCFAWDYGEIGEPEQVTLHLRKNTWGFRTISVSSDALFVRPERASFTTDEFAGSTFDLNLILDTNLMHAGNNFARLTLSTGSQTLQIEMTAKKKPLYPRDRQARIRRIMTKKLENLYVEFRLQKMNLPTWIENSVSVLNSYRRAGGDDPFADLLLVQMYYADDKKHRAKKLLEQVEAQKERLDTQERYCFYLYITTFFYREASYVDRVEEEVVRQFYRNQESWQLQWILLYLQESYLNDPEARYEAVAAQFQSGCRSRILYVEAWQALKGNPFLMRHLGEFELHLLRFACREKVLTAEILRQTANLAMHHTGFDRRLYEALSDGCRMYPSEDLVRAICQILIRGEKKEREYFEWYEKGVENGLRMNGLYEAYMQTMECSEFRELPQIIRMYFPYDTSLDYRKRAAIYRSIADNREHDPQTWLNYRPAMERFVMEQLEALHLSSDLAVLYSCFLREGMLTEALAKKLIRLLFTYEITCDDPQVRQIVVHSSRIPGEQTVHLKNGRAQIPIYDPDGAVLAVDESGHRCEAHRVCAVTHVFEDEKLLAWCAKKAPEHPGLVVFLCVESQKAKLMNDRLLPYFQAGCALREISDGFRDELRQNVLSYYMEHPREDSLPEFLETIPLEEYVLVDKTALITLLAEESRCTDAFELLNRYGAEDIPLIQLVRICSRMVLEFEFGENAMLLALCHQCFSEGKYDDKLLRYLVLYWEGPVEDMKQVWSAACEFGLDTMLMEEKILMMMLFTRSGTQGSEPVFEAYRKKMGRKKLCRAYVNLKSYEYFVKGIPVAEPVFAYIENDYRRQSGNDRLEEQEEVCRLALLQHYARAVSLTKTQRVYAEEMLEEFNTKGMRFAFFGRFDRELRKPWQMEGHVFAEYAGNPKSTVYILYRYKGTKEENTFIKEIVPNCFEGIFVREFTLFADEEIECIFEEHCPNPVSGTDVGQKEGPVVRSDKWTLRADQEESGGGMYGLLNRFCAALREGDEAKEQETLDSWLTLEYLAEEVFTLV
ncbi:MAG: DUF5717 family protein [Lachnospiraceae bacterium]|nr:DUF5717 family protein [Lachnospiraceae bacterium]